VSYEATVAVLLFVVIVIVFLAIGVGGLVGSLMARRKK